MTKVKKWLAPWKSKLSRVKTSGMQIKNILDRNKDLKFVILPNSNGDSCLFLTSTESEGKDYYFMQKM